MSRDNEILKKQLRYQGAQYSNGSIARGGNGKPHMLTMAADRIDALERALENLRDAMKDAPNPNISSYIDAVLDGGYTPDVPNGVIQGPRSGPAGMEGSTHPLIGE